MRRLRVWVLFLGLFWGTVPAWTGTLTVGAVDSDAAQQFKLFLPLANFLAQNLKGQGVERGEVIVSDRIQGMADLMRSNKVDVYIDSPFPALAVSELVKADIHLRRWKKGQAEYGSVLVSLKDSQVNSIKDLAGKSVAFEEPYSTTGYFLPKSELNNAGLQLAESHESPVGSQVRFQFTGNIRNSLPQLLWKKVDAIALGTHEFEALDPEQSKNLKVIHRSARLPRHVVVFRPGLETGLVKAIIATLKHMDQTEEGRQVLLGFEKTTRFDEIPKEGLKAMEQLRQEVKQEIKKSFR